MNLHSLLLTIVHSEYGPNAVAFVLTSHQFFRADVCICFLDAIAAQSATIEKEPTQWQQIN